MFCENCGGQMADGSKFCIVCGAKVESNETVQDVAAREAAASVEDTATVAQEPAPAFVPPAAPQSVPLQPAQPVKPQFAPPQPVQPQFAPPQPIQPQQQVISQPVNVGKPASTTPLPVWKYIGIFLLMGIPILGIIMIFVWAFGSSCNQNTKNFARAVLIMSLIAVVLTVIGYFTIWTSVQDIISNYNMPVF